MPGPMRPKPLIATFTGILGSFVLRSERNGWYLAYHILLDSGAEAPENWYLRGSSISGTIVVIDYTWSLLSLPLSLTGPACGKICIFSEVSLNSTFTEFNVRQEHGKPHFVRLHDSVVKRLEAQLGQHERGLLLGSIEPGEGCTIAVEEFEPAALIEERQLDAGVPQAGAAIRWWPFALIPNPGLSRGGDRRVAPAFPQRAAAGVTSETAQSGSGNRDVFPGRGRSAFGGPGYGGVSVQFA